MLGHPQTRVSKRVLIIGGGIVGFSTAYYAAHKGHRVVLLERGGLDRGGCSFANAGMVVPSHFIPLASPGMVQLGLRWMWNAESPFYVKPRLSGDLLGWGVKFIRAATSEHVTRSAPLLRDLHLASRTCYEEWAGLWGDDFGWVEGGLLVLCKTEHALEEEAKTAEHARQLGIPADVLSASATAELEPHVRLDVAGSILFPMDAHLVPSRLMSALTQRVRQAGVQLVWNTPVTGWRVSGHRVEAVRTELAEYVADEYVLCAGVWSMNLVRDLGLRIPMQAGKGYSLTLESPPWLPNLCAILSEARVAMTPMGTALRFGGTMELAGVDESINGARVRGIIKSVPRYYPDLTPELFDGIPVRHGLRPCSPDGLPFIGRFARFVNLSAATGHAMMGVSLGPITGKLMAEILSDEPVSVNVGALSPDRYA